MARSSSIFTVRSGDCLKIIARDHQTSVRDMIKANPWLATVERADGRFVLVPGKVLRIPPAVSAPMLATQVKRLAPLPVAKATTPRVSLHMGDRIIMLGQNGASPRVGTVRGYYVDMIVSERYNVLFDGDQELTVVFPHNLRISNSHR